MKRLPRSLDEIGGLRVARWIRESTAGQYDRYGPIERIVVAGRSIIGACLTPAAYANGLARAVALPQVVMARPEGVGRAGTTAARGYWRIRRTTRRGKAEEESGRG